MNNNNIVHIWIYIYDSEDWMGRTGMKVLPDMTLSGVLLLDQTEAHRCPWHQDSRGRICSGYSGKEESWAVSVLWYSSDKVRKQLLLVAANDAPVVHSVLHAQLLLFIFDSVVES